MAWERWSGGRVWVAKDGTRTYYGEVGGRMVSTRRHDEESALAEVVRLNLGARPGPRPPFDDGLIAEYVDDCARRGQCRQTLNKKRRILHDWKEEVGPRRPDLLLLNQITDGMDGARNRISVLKAYFTWLRQRGVVRRQDDPTLDLRKPEAAPPAEGRLIPIDSHRAVLPELSQRWADILVLMMGTGIHISEAYRFAQSGTIVGDVLHVGRHKSGEPHKVRVTPRVLEAARRVRERGGFSAAHLYRAIYAACERAGVPYFAPGGYRHTVAMNALEAGATPEQVAYALGHTTSYMVKRVYGRWAVPPKIPTAE